MKKTLANIEEFCDFSIKPCSMNTTQSFMQPITLSITQKIQLGSFVQSVPAILELSSVPDLYVVSFPEGLPHTLTQLKQGGYGSMIKDPETNRFVGSASFHHAGIETIIASAFSILSIATAQYYLSEMSDRLDMINQKLDKIVNFLYGNKKAELLSEISFTRYAYQNFTSIMKCPEQRIATITGLQSAKKIALKDIEFYLYDLYSTVSEKNDFQILTKSAFQINESIDRSTQLYATAGLLEVCYSGNSDPEYIKFIEDDLTDYLEKSEKQVIANFNILRTKIDNSITPLPIKDINKSQLVNQIDDFLNKKRQERISDKYREIRDALRRVSSPLEYYISLDGEVYVSKKNEYHQSYI